METVLFGPAQMTALPANEISVNEAFETVPVVWQAPNLVEVWVVPVGTSLKSSSATHTPG